MSRVTLFCMNPLVSLPSPLVPQVAQNMVMISQSIMTVNEIGHPMHACIAAIGRNYIDRISWFLHTFQESSMNYSFGMSSIHFLPGKKTVKRSQRHIAWDLPQLPDPSRGCLCQFAHVIACPFWLLANLHPLARSTLVVAWCCTFSYCLQQYR